MGRAHFAGKIVRGGQDLGARGRLRLSLPSELPPEGTLQYRPDGTVIQRQDTSVIDTPAVLTPFGHSSRTLAAPIGADTFIDPPPATLRACLPMIKRFIIALVLLILIGGGIVGFNLFREKAIADFFANMPRPALTVSTIDVAP